MNKVCRFWWDFLNLKLFVILCLLSWSNNNCCAFLAAAHLYVTNKIIDNLIEDDKLRCDIRFNLANYRKYVESASIEADVGRFEIDGTKILSGGRKIVVPNSDGVNFISKAESLAKSKSDRFYAFGLRLHLWEDQLWLKFNSFVFNNRTKESYFVRYGKVERYLLKNNMIGFCTRSFNIDSRVLDYSPILLAVKNKFIIRVYLYFCSSGLINKYYNKHLSFFEVLGNYDFLIRIYRSFGKVIDRQMLKKQIDNLVGAHVLLSTSGFTKDMSSNEAAKADVMLEKIINELSDKSRRWLNKNF